MRALHLGATFPPEGRGGYEQQCADAVAFLAARGWDQRVLAGADVEGRRFVRARGGERPPGGAHGHRGDAHRVGGAGDVEVRRVLPRFPAVPGPVDPAQAAAWERRSGAVLDEALGAFAPDVVCFWRLGELSQSLVPRVAEAGVPAVGVVCDRWPVDGPLRDPWCRLRSRAPAIGDLAEWLVVSDWLREDLARAGVVLRGGGRCAPAPDPAVFAPRAAAPPWRGELLVAGRLSERKGPDDAVAALARLPGMRLTLVGDGRGADRARLRALARDHGVADRVRLEAGADRGAVATRMARADAVLFCVRWDEPWGLVPLEAMGVGVPVVATGTGGSAAYLRDGDNALLVPRESPDAVAAAVRRLAEDAALRDRLVAGGRRTVARHPPDAAPRAVEAALLRAVGPAVRA